MRLDVERRPNDCVPASLAVVTDTNYASLPLPRPADNWTDWVEAYNEALTDAGATFGIDVVWHTPRRPRGLWVGVTGLQYVDSTGTAHYHAVVLDGRELAFNPSGRDTVQLSDVVAQIKINRRKRERG